MVWRWAGKVVGVTGLLAVGSCVSPVELPTDREVVPPKRSIPLTVEETVELSTELFQGSEEEFTWQRYRAEVAEAILDTATGVENLRLQLRIVSTEPPPRRQLWLDTAELAIDGLRSGVETENLWVVRSLRLTFWETSNGVTARRIWQWHRGEPLLPNVRIRLQLVRSTTASRARWLLGIRVFLLWPEIQPPPRRSLQLRCILRLAPA